MPYHYLEDLTVEDAAFEASGESLDELFQAAWEAALGLMIENPEALRPMEYRMVELEELSVDMLLYAFLGELLFWKDAEQLLLRAERVAVSGNDEVGYRVVARLAGERIDPSRHELGIDVKAVTLDQFYVGLSDDTWTGQVIVDT